jgi:hypothetical protein
MAKSVGINLDIEPRHWTAGNAASLKHRQRIEREKAIAKGDVVIRPEHRLAGAEAANRAKALKKRGRAITLPADSVKPAIAPFSRAGEAIQMLLGIFGYPTSKLNVPKDIGVVHRMGLPDEDAEPIAPTVLRERPLSGKPENYRQTSTGAIEKRCHTCRVWHPLTDDYYRHKTDRMTKSWASDCHPCERERRRVAWKRRYQLQKLGLAK